jgi:hypothetical protein
VIFPFSFLFLFSFALFLSPLLSTMICLVPFFFRFLFFLVSVVPSFFVGDFLCFVETSFQAKATKKKVKFLCLDYHELMSSLFIEECRLTS